MTSVADMIYHETQLPQSPASKTEVRNPQSHTTEFGGGEQSRSTTNNKLKIKYTMGPKCFGVFTHIAIMLFAAALALNTQHTLSITSGVAMPLATPESSD